MPPTPDDAGRRRLLRPGTDNLSRGYRANCAEPMVGRSLISNRGGATFVRHVHDDQ